jgi:hypothetical protein
MDRPLKIMRNSLSGYINENKEALIKLVFIEKDCLDDRKLKSLEADSINIERIKLFLPPHTRLTSYGFRSFTKKLKHQVKILSYLGYKKQFVEECLKTIYDLEDIRTESRKQLSYYFEELENKFESIDESLKNKLSKLDNEQIDRLDESLTNYFNECYLSSVIMSVSAVEWELSKILKNDEKISNLYDTDKKYKDRIPTFGTLISFFYEYVDDAALSSYSWLRDSKKLLDLCNECRNFSAHPKGRKISNRICNSILLLTFEFLLSKPNTR